MNDKFDERLSGLMDGELHDDVLSQLEHDEALRSRWMRYHMIRDVLSGHSAEATTTDLAARIRQAIENEPTILAPQRSTSRKQAIMKQVAGFAIAATVATVAVISVQTTSVTDNPQAAGPQLALKSTALPDGVQQVTTNPRRLDKAVESKLSGYIVNHNEYSVTARMQGMMPYSRIVSITPNERVVITPDEPAVISNSNDK